MTVLLRLFVCLFFLTLAACGDSDDEDLNLPENEPVDVLYNRAMDEYDQGNYKSAKTAFEEVERQHPYSQWAKRAQVMNAYTSYRNQDYDDAIIILERYVKLYPGDASSQYAYYLIALSRYEQISDVGRDQANTRAAMSALEDVKRRYPESSYARDAAIKLDLTTDHLAGKEMEVGRYYLVRQEYLSAIGRFQRVIDEYETTSHVPEALHRLVECFLKLGVPNEAQRYAAVLGHNFPQSDWYKESYALLNPGKNTPKPAEEESWYSRMF